MHRFIFQSALLFEQCKSVGASINVLRVEYTQYCISTLAQGLCIDPIGQFKTIPLRKIKAVIARVCHR